jgi:hypothetical protein
MGFVIEIITNLACVVVQEVDRLADSAIALLKVLPASRTRIPMSDCI